MLNIHTYASHMSNQKDNMHMYLRTHVCIYIYIYIQTKQTNKCIYIYTHTYVYISIYLNKNPDRTCRRWGGSFLRDYTVQTAPCLIYRICMSPAPSRLVCASLYASLLHCCCQ